MLVTHYFVTDQGREPELSDAETTIHVGGLDNVEVSLFEGFDYVALGHIHKPQQIHAVCRRHDFRLHQVRYLSADPPQFVKRGKRYFFYGYLPEGT